MCRFAGSRSRTMKYKAQSGNDINKAAHVKLTLLALRVCILVAASRLAWPALIIRNPSCIK